MSDTKTIIQKAAEAITATEDEKLAFKRRLFETADRSYLNDRFNVTLPEGLYGEWIGTDDFSQYNAQTKGFVDGAEYLGAFNKIHEQADGKSTIGDVKFMVIPKWKYEAHQEMAAVEAARKSGLTADHGRDLYAAHARSIGLNVEPEKATARIIDGNELNAITKR